MDNNIVIHFPMASFLLDLKQIVKDTIHETMQTQNIFGSHLPEDNSRSDLLSRTELADLLGISLPTLDARIKDGSIPYCRIGKKVLFDKNKVMESILVKGNKK